ncbi:MAG: LicD family protein [Propionibacterium sp.]|nr:LicD family protein [Propionibacterium sp.]MDN6793460.1 LicD family protein [Propionibacterium sp.]
MAYKEYEDPRELRSVQLAVTEILEEFCRVCEGLGVRYVVYGGTAIGAVRHRGFIPWDDDIDVCMPREDYERFLSAAPAVLRDRFEIANARTEADFPSTYSQLTLKGTRFVPEYYKDADYQPRLNIDMFPLDNAADDPRILRSQLRRTWLWGRLKFLRATPAPYLEVEGWKRRMILAVCSLAHGTLKMVRIRPVTLQWHWEKAARECEHTRTRLLADFSDRSPMDWAVSLDDLFPAVDAQFEDLTVKLPRNYDEILTRGYGNYMELPPVEKRKNHYPHVVDLGGSDRSGHGSQREGL